MYERRKEIDNTAKLNHYYLITCLNNVLILHENHSQCIESLYSHVIS